MPAKPRYAMSMIPIDPNALLTRELTAEALTAGGYITSPKTLATKATRGGGPPYRLFGARALYRWGDALEWAESRLGPLRGSTSEQDVTGRTGGGERRLKDSGAPIPPMSADYTKPISRTESSALTSGSAQHPSYSPRARILNTR